MSKTIPLSRNQVAIVDDEDFKLVRGHNWHAVKTRRTWYARTKTRVNGKQMSVLMHRLIANASNGQQIDHADNNGLNNQRHNLRPATHKQNMYNRPPYASNTSGFKGVCRHKDKWVAMIGYNGQRLHLGRFSSPTDAAKAYDAKAKELFGEFAYLNFPELREDAEVATA
jgi:hypothetical protein